MDDPRNTDNSWMETIAFNFHDEDGSVFESFKLTAGRVLAVLKSMFKSRHCEANVGLKGDDAGSVRWMDLARDLKLYASHASFVEKAAKLHKAHW